jgi:hypothetical protein
MSEVSENFLDAFGDALSVDGDLHSFTFSNYSTARLTCLWVKDVSAYLHTHSHELNYVVFQNEKLCLIKASDVPENAVLRANDYLTIDNTRYKIANARLKDCIWTLQLMIIGTT